MAEINIIPYNPSKREEWDAFVSTSRNATFLFLRDYMDYHADRFTDMSWMAYKGNRLIAVLPANIDNDNTLYSHQGLTYGGWLLPASHLDGADLLDIFQTIIPIWREWRIDKLIYKAVPNIYHSRPSQEDIYSLFRLGAHIRETNLSMAIDLSNPGNYNKLRKRKLTGTRHWVDKVEEMETAEETMALVSQCLLDRHNAVAVHSAGEIQLLKQRFPNNIKFFGIRGDDGNLNAAVCIYDTGMVAHAQYIATDERGRELDLLTPLFTRLIQREFADRAYFDFGTSNENHGKRLNRGLLRQKASFGATGVAYTTYELDIKM